jgi:hypothetical protein
MREGVLWTNLSRSEISRQLAEMGSPANRHTVRKLLKKHGLGQRKARKKKSLGNHPDRDAQFQNIAKLKAAYQNAGDPVISMDTKKKELIGNFAREGHTYTQAQVDTLDHDFPSAGEGKVIPHGLYDLARNEGYVHLNTATTPVNFAVTVLHIGGNSMAARIILMPAVCCCFVMVAVATPVIGMSSRKRYKSWPTGWDWTYV